MPISQVGGKKKKKRRNGVGYTILRGTGTHRGKKREGRSILRAMEKKKEKGGEGDICF